MTDTLSEREVENRNECPDCGSENTERVSVEWYEKHAREHRACISCHRQYEVGLKATYSKNDRPFDREDTNPIVLQGLDLTEGQDVLFNDRARPLTVSGFHFRENQSRVWRRRGRTKFIKVVELEGNGTEYHLLCHPGSSYGPMLYKEADWDSDKTNKNGDSPKYSRMGERVESLEVLDDE